MTDTKMIENYLLWKRDKELYPPQWTPDEWAKELIMSEANARINIIKDLLENNPELDAIEFANEVHRITYDPLEELMNERVPMGAGGEAQSMGQEEDSGDSLLEGA
jgi:hypothetical protein